MYSLIELLEYIFFLNLAITRTSVFLPFPIASLRHATFLIGHFPSLIDKLLVLIFQHKKVLFLGLLTLFLDFFIDGLPRFLASKPEKSHKNYTTFSHVEIVPVLGMENLAAV